MKDFASIIGFLVILILFSMSVGGQNTTQNSDFGFAGESGFLSADGTTESPSEVDETAIKNRIAEIEEEIGDLKEQEREDILRSPKSPYQDLVSLEKAAATEERWSYEHLYLSISRDAESSIDITGWALESYVTRERTKIPEGDRLIEVRKSPVLERIKLFPGENAYLITGRSPVGVSFKENMCTGYFSEKREFAPGLSHQCPDPIEEMEEYSRVSYTNDECYDFVETLSSCRIPDEDLVKEADISNACEDFIEKHLIYEGCVKNHRLDANFDESGNWYIYLGRTRDLWRSEREIIRLLDAQGRVVDVVEY